jgi:FkbM family methyltransferase
MSKLIYDIGMHNGRDTEFYLKKGFQVVAVEAHPQLVSKAKEYFAEYIRQGKLTIIDKAITKEPQNDLEFFINPDKDDWGTVLNTWNRSMSENFISINVPTITFEEILDQFGPPYYLKIDIEGSDIICLQGLLKTSYRPEHISVELLSPGNLNQTDVDCLAILSHLYVLGYRKFKVSDQSKNHLLKAPFPALEGEYIDYKFDGYCSGLFGKELNTVDLSFDELAEAYLKYFFQKGDIAPRNFWARVLRKDKKKHSIFHNEGWFDVHAKM